MADRQARRPPRHPSSRRGKGGGFPPPSRSDRPVQQPRHDPLPAPFPAAPPPHLPPLYPPQHEMRGQESREMFPSATEEAFRLQHHVNIEEMIPPLPPYLMNMSSPMTADPSHFSPFSPLTPESIRQAREQDFYASHLRPLPPGFHPMPHHPPFPHPHGPFDPPFRYPQTERLVPMRHLPPPSLPPPSHYEHHMPTSHNEHQGGPPKPLRLAVPGVQPAPLSDSPSNEQIRSIEREISRLLFSPTSSDEQLERDAEAPQAPPPAVLPSLPTEAKAITSNLFVVEKKLREPGPDFFIALNEQIHHLLQEMEPHEEEYARWHEVVTETRRVVQDCFPDALLHQFGSTANGLSTRSADIDLCLSFPSDSPHYAMPAAETVQQLGDYLKAKARAISGEPEEEEGDAPQLASEQHFPTLEANTRSKKSEEEAPRPRWRFSDFKVLTRTRIPIVKFKDAVSGCQIDIGCNNLLAVENTRLLKAYTLIDDRFRQAALVIKHWTKQRGIADTYNGTLSSYAYNLMLIHYLQWRCYPAVLPNLQALGQKVPAGREKHPLLDPYTTTFLEDMSALPQLWPQGGQNRQNIAELVYGFFVYYAFEFEFKDWVASVRLGRAILKVEKGWFGMKSDREAPAPDATAIASHEDEAKPKAEEVKPKEEEEDETEALSAEEKQKAATERFFKRQRFWFCVEDPFETEHNLGRVVDRNGLYLVRGEFITAVNFLASFAPRSSPGQPLQKPRIFAQYPPPQYIGVLKRLCRHWEDEKDAHARSVNRQKIQQQYDTFTTSEPGKGEKQKQPKPAQEGAKEDPDVFEHGRDRRDISRMVRERKDRSGHFSHRQNRPKSEGEKGRKHVK